MEPCVPVCRSRIIDGKCHKSKQKAELQMGTMAPGQHRDQMGWVVLSGTRTAPGPDGLGCTVWHQDSTGIRWAGLCCVLVPRSDGLGCSVCWLCAHCWISPFCACLLNPMSLGVRGSLGTELGASLIMNIIAESLLAE
ncbi:hypothetical protein FKM82_020762 [Ascaphus truei]